MRPPTAAALRSVEVSASSHCPRECRLRAVVEADRLIGLEAEEGAAPCPRCLDSARALEERRLSTPLRPRAARRLRDASHDLVPIPWSESLDRLARAFAQVGRGERRLVWIHAADRPRLSAAYAFRVGALAGDVVHLHHETDTQALALLAGDLVPRPMRLDAAAGLDGRVVAWGIDPLRSPAIFRRPLMRGEGSLVLVVDPRRSSSARRAGSHLALRPGTDGALALGLAAGLAERAGRNDARLAGWSTARAAEICRMDRSVLDAAVATLAGGRATLLVGAGLLGSGDPRHALEALVVLAETAGLRLLSPRRLRPPARDVPAPDPRGSVEEVSSGRLKDFLASTDPATDVVIVEGGDPLESWGGGPLLEGYLRRARFVVVLAAHRSPVCQHADLVLPVVSFLEHGDLEARHWGRVHRWGQAALPPAGESYSRQRIWAAVARRLQWPGQWLSASLEQLAEQMTTIVDPAAPVAVPTAAPIYRETGEGPLATPRLHRALPLHLVLCTDPEDGSGVAPGTRRVLLATEDARLRGIEEGDQVVVYNERGKVEGRAVIDPDQPCGVVVLAWWERGVVGDAPAVLLDPAVGRGPCLVEVDAPARKGEPSRTTP
ncbi:MAG: molybdopterin-dependent oxidoreductase [Acidobacteriota bacterium]|nr:molybdopterin-dependent oxidoreductase [Acidobacteriota bacterium]MDQ7087306.1 molybdopterin-dependent oxidoreductase [Acidobacteriota bacterium]